MGREGGREGEFRCQDLPRNEFLICRFRVIEVSLDLNMSNCCRYKDTYCPLLFILVVAMVVHISVTFSFIF